MIDAVLANFSEKSLQQFLLATKPGIEHIYVDYARINGSSHPSSACSLLKL
jgi:hypothetical protein